ncbi:hypothetical protein SAMN05421766_105103 [Zobellia uliginosa]|uniref:Uncharacterized protein n=1 Tax=Zobellia uliginosa TaxID=143224 RepID=A0ABY1KZ30_9FLAO|nr:hypothetical protein SAMN05421766_105103 [Zobellia uliginosa]
MGVYKFIPYKAEYCDKISLFPPCFISVLKDAPVSAWWGEKIIYGHFRRGS